MKHRVLLALLAASCLFIGLHESHADALPSRPQLWIDLYRAEPVRFEEMAEDLAASRVVYIGETHTIDRHHEIQEAITRAHLERGKTVVLALEPLEIDTAEQVARYNRGELDFDGFAAAVGWKTRWSTYEDYRALVELVHGKGMPILALNANADLVRKVGRQGLAALTPEERSRLPETLDLEDAPYRRHLERVLMVHAKFTPEMLDNVFAAQVARDETMAQALAAFLQQPENKDAIAVVIVGAGHVSYGLGLPERLQQRLPGTRDRIVLVSESGDLTLSEPERRQSREIRITHEDLRSLGRPVGDYLHVTGLQNAQD